MSPHNTTTAEITELVRAAVADLMPPPDDRLVTADEVIQIIGEASRSSFYQRLKHDPSFPRPIHLGERRVRWSRLAVLRWIAAQHAQAQVTEAEA